MLQAQCLSLLLRKDLYIVGASWFVPRSYFLNNNKDCLLLYVFAYNPGEVFCWTKPKVLWNFVHCLSYFHHSGSCPDYSEMHNRDFILPLLSKWTQSSKHEDLLIFYTKHLPMHVDNKSDHKNTYLFCCSSESQSCLQSEHISAHCVYSANYAWRLCTPSAAVDSPQMNLFLRLVVEVQSVCLDHSFISLPIPCSHLYVTSDEQSCCSLLETLHASLAL